MSTTAAPVWRLHGLAVQSPLPLGRRPVADDTVPDIELEVMDPAPIPAEPPEGECTVSFVLGDTPVYRAARQHGQDVLRVHGLCDFVTTDDGGPVRCRPDPDADLEHVALVARGALLAWWLGLRGEPTLHASAVELDGHGIVFVGSSGMGKSTLAGWACRLGARFVSDDLLRLSGDEAPRWVGSSPELRLRDGAVGLLEGRHRQWAVRTSVDGRRAAEPLRPERDDGPVSIVVVPQPTRGASDVELTRLDPVAGALCLSRFSRLEGWRLPSAVEAQFDASSRLADVVPVVVAGVPWGPPFRDAVARSLLEQVLALAEPAGAAK